MAKARPCTLASSASASSALAPHELAAEAAVQVVHPGQQRLVCNSVVHLHECKSCRKLLLEQARHEHPSQRCFRVVVTELAARAALQAVQLGQQRLVCSAVHLQACKL